MDRPHGDEKRVHSPVGVGLTKTKRVSDVKKQQENRSDSIKHRRFQVLPPEINSGFAPVYMGREWTVRLFSLHHTGFLAEKVQAVVRLRLSFSAQVRYGEGGGTVPIPKYFLGGGSRRFCQWWRSSFFYSTCVSSLGSTSRG